jgi:hypothetical protein
MRCWRAVILPNTIWRTPLALIYAAAWAETRTRESLTARRLNWRSKRRSSGFLQSGSTICPLEATSPLAASDGAGSKKMENSEPKLINQRETQEMLQ